MPAPTKKGRQIEETRFGTGADSHREYYWDGKVWTPSGKVVPKQISTFRGKGKIIIRDGATLKEIVVPDVDYGRMSGASNIFMAQYGDSMIHVDGRWEYNPDTLTPEDDAFFQQEYEKELASWAEGIFGRSELGFGKPWTAPENYGATISAQRGDWKSESDQAVAFRGKIAKKFIENRDRVFNMSIDEVRNAITGWGAGTGPETAALANSFGNMSQKDPGEKVSDADAKLMAESVVMKYTNQPLADVREMIRTGKIPALPPALLEAMKNPYVMTTATTKGPGGDIFQTEEIMQPNPLIGQLFDLYTQDVDRQFTAMRDLRERQEREGTAESDRNADINRALIASTGGMSGWEWKAVRDPFSDTYVTNWVRTGLSALELQQHEIYLAKTSATGGFGNLSEEELMDFQRQKTLLAATGGLAGRGVDEEGEPIGLTPEQVAALESWQAMIGPTGGMGMAMDQILNILDIQATPGELTLEQTNEQERLFGAIFPGLVGQGKRMESMRGLTPLELAMIELAPTQIEAERLKEELRMNRDERGINWKEIDANKLTLSQRAMLNDILAQEAERVQTQAELDLTPDELSGMAFAEGLTLEQQEAIKNMSLREREAFFLEQEQIRDFEQLQAQLNLAEAEAKEAGEQFDRDLTQRQLEWGQSWERSATEFNMQEERLKQEFSQLQQLREAENARAQQQANVLFGPEGIESAEFQARFGGAEGGLEGRAQTLAEQQTAAQFGGLPTTMGGEEPGLALQQLGEQRLARQLEEQQMAAQFAGFPTTMTGGEGLAFRQQEEAEAARAFAQSQATQGMAEQIRQFNLQQAAQFGGVGAVGLDVRRQDEAEAARLFAQEQQVADVAEQQRRFNEQLAISQRAQTLSESQAIQQSQEFAQQLALAQQQQAAQLEQQRRMEAARFAADPTSIAALTTVYGPNVFGAGQPLGMATPTGTTETTPPAIPATFSPANYPSPFRTTPFPTQLTPGSALQAGQYASLTPFAQSQYETQKALQGLSPETAAAERRAITAADIAQAGRIGTLA